MPDDALDVHAADARETAEDLLASWAERVGVGVAALRVGLGMGAFVMPGKAGRAWIGPGASGRDRAVLLRALAGRDIALGAGALLARRADDRRRWVALGALSDLCDTVATLIAFPVLPRRLRWLVLASCAGAAMAGAAAAGLAPADPTPSPPEG